MLVFSLLLHVFLYAVDCFKIKKDYFSKLGEFLIIGYFSGKILVTLISHRLLLRESSFCKAGLLSKVLCSELLTKSLHVFFEKNW